MHSAPALLLALAALALPARAALLGDVAYDEAIVTAAELAPARVWYATSPTAAATAAKVATTLDGGFVLTNGATVLVKFSYANTAATPTLSVDGTDAKTVRKYGATSALAYGWNAGEVVPLVYDGTQWEIVKGGWATTTYYGATKLSSATNSTSTALAATPSAVLAVRQEVGKVAAALAAYTPPAPTWDAATLGANPTIALAVAADTCYQRTGTGTLTISSISGLSSAPTYLVASGFSSLVLPSGFTVAGSGAFRAGKTNHFTLWTTPAGSAVNFLFAE